MVILDKVFAAFRIYTFRFCNVIYGKADYCSFLVSMKDLYPEFFVYSCCSPDSVSLLIAVSSLISQEFSKMVGTEGKYFEIQVSSSLENAFPSLFQTSEA